MAAAAAASVALVHDGLFFSRFRMTAAPNWRRAADACSTPVAAVLGRTARRRGPMFVYDLFALHNV